MNESDLLLSSKRSLLPFDDNAPLGVKEHVVAVAVLARRDMIIVASCRDADDFAAGQSLQGDHGEQILLHRRVVGGERETQPSMPPSRTRSNDASHVYSWCLLLSNQMVANFAGSERMPQIASREATIADASDGSLSCNKESTLSTSRSYSGRSSARVVLSFPGSKPGIDRAGRRPGF